MRNGKTTMTQSIVFPSQEVRDVVMKGGLTPKGTSEFYERLERRWHSRHLRLGT